MEKIDWLKTKRQGSLFGMETGRNGGGSVLFSMEKNSGVW